MLEVLSPSQPSHSPSRRLHTSPTVPSPSALPASLTVVHRSTRRKRPRSESPLPSCHHPMFEDFDPAAFTR
jgi:hypothetical protein